MSYNIFFVYGIVEIIIGIFGFLSESIIRNANQIASTIFIPNPLSDFIINQEDINGDGLFNFEDVNMLVDHLHQGLPFNISYDFNSDQNISILDILILSDLIF